MVAKQISFSNENQMTFPWFSYEKIWLLFQLGRSDKCLVIIFYAQYALD